MKTTVKCFAALCAWAALWGYAASAHASLVGTGYILAANNSPGTGNGPVVIDGVFSPVAATGLEVNETITPIPVAIPALNVQPGDYYLEFNVRTINGAGIVPSIPGFGGSTGNPSGIFFIGVSDPALPGGGTTRQDSDFIYFTRDGVPQNQMVDALNNGLVFGPHPILGFNDNGTPTNPNDDTGAKVLFLGTNTQLLSAGLGIDTNALAPGTPLSTVFLALGLAAQINNIDDFHLGVAVPEPGTIALACVALVGLIPVVRRRRK